MWGLSEVVLGMLGWIRDRFFGFLVTEETQEISYQWLLNHPLLKKKSDCIEIAASAPAERSESTHYLWPSKKGGQYIGCWLSGKKNPKRYRNLEVASKVIRKHLKHELEKCVARFPIKELECVDARVSHEEGHARRWYVWPSKTRLGMIGFRDASGSDPVLVSSIGALIHHIEKRLIS